MAISKQTFRNAMQFKQQLMECGQQSKTIPPPLYISFASNEEQRD